MNARRFLFLSSAVLLMLAGCFSPKRSPAVRYFRLTSPVPASKEETRLSGRPLFVGPVELSPYLDRPQIAERRGENEIAYREFQRWAEPLDRNVARVVAQELSAQLTSRPVTAGAMRQASAAESETLSIRLLQFEIGARGEAWMRAEVTLPDGKRRVFEETEKIRMPGVEGEVAALNRLILRFAREIGKEIKP